MHFSFSTLNMLLEHPHCWVNKMAGIKQEDKEYFKLGRAGHNVIQKHVSGKEPHEHLKHITEKFPIVEERAFDDRCRFEFQYKGYKIVGFFDGLDPEAGRFLEIKLSGNPWSIAKFKKAEQRKLYALAWPEATESVLITGKLNQDEWEKEPPKIYTVPVTKKDRESVKKWMDSALAVFEEGDFTKDLEDGRCNDPWCYWGKNCVFKK